MEYTELQFQPAAVILQMLFNIATKRFRISGLFCSFIVGIMVFDATVFEAENVFFPLLRSFVTPPVEWFP